MQTMSMTHTQVQTAVAYWLVQTKHPITFDEGTWGDWRVDVLGLGTRITVVEVKISRPDFLKDFGCPDRARSRGQKLEPEIRALDRLVLAEEAKLQAAAQKIGLSPQQVHWGHEWRQYRELPEFKEHLRLVRERTALVRKQATASGRGFKAQALLTSGMGHRFFVGTPSGLVTPEEVPYGWGLVEVTKVPSGHWPGSCVVRKKCEVQRLEDEQRARIRWLARCATRCSFELRQARAQVEELRKLLKKGQGDV